MTRHSYIMLSAAIAVALTVSMAADATEVKLRPQIESRSPVVRLGDVAEVVADDVAEQRRLAGLLLMPAPAPGTQRFVRQREVADMLAAHGEDVSRLRIGGANQIAIVSTSAAGVSTPATVDRGTVDRQAVLLAGQTKRTNMAPREEKQFDELDAERVRGQLDGLIVEYLTSKAGHVDAWRVTTNVADRSLAMLQTATSAPKCMGGSEPWTGRQRFVISFSTTKGTVQVPVYAEVALAMPVVVAIRPIDKDAVVTAAHVAVQTVEYMQSAKDRRVPVESVEKLVGMEAQEAIRAGEMVYADQVRAPLMVKRGEEVTVVSQGGGIRVRTLARVMQDGSLGELVRVETLDKKDSYDARVTGSRQVAVFTTARPIDAQPKLERADTAWRSK